MTHQFSKVLDPIIDGAFSRHAQGERVVWEAALMPHQVAQGQPPQPVYTVFAWMKGATLDTVMNGSFIACENPLDIDFERVRETVRQFLEALRNARSQALQQMQAQSNGHGPQEPGTGPSGLIIP